MKLNLGEMKLNFGVIKLNFRIMNLHIYCKLRNRTVKGIYIYIMVINRIDIFKFWLFLSLPIIDNSPNFISGNTSNNEKHK